MRYRITGRFVRMDSAAATPQERATLSREIGEVIYAIQCPDGAIKIGYTSDLAGRIARYGHGYKPLGFMAGTRRQEGLIHRTLKQHRVRGNEYYDHSPSVLSVVNHMRAMQGKAPLKSATRTP